MIKFTFLQKNSGFTFVELLLVILLIVIMLVMSAPHLRPAFMRLEVFSFTKRLTSLIRYAQGRAITERERFYLAYKATNPEKRNFSLEKDAPNSSPEENKRISLEERYRLYVPSSLKIEIDPPSSELIFYPDSTIRELKVISVKNDFQKAKISFENPGIGRINVEYSEE